MEFAALGQQVYKPPVGGQVTTAVQQYNLTQSNSENITHHTIQISVP